MCARCARATLRLMDAGYARDWAVEFLWNQTAYPIGDNALDIVTRFLRVKRRNRRRWFNRQDNLTAREMARYADDSFSAPATAVSAAPAPAPHSLDDASPREERP